MPSVLVVGDAILDEYIYGVTTRISPEAPVPVVVEQRRELRPGGAANVAKNIQSLGGDVTLLTVAGHGFTAITGDFNIASVLIDRPHTRKTRIVSAGQQLVRLDAEDRSAISSDTVGQLAEAYYHLLRKPVDIVVISDYCMGMITPSLATVLVHSARVRGIPVIVDTKKRDIGCFRDCSVVTPNIKELAEMGGVREIWRLGAHAIVTKSELGVDYLPYEGRHESVAAIHQEVVDVTGAGDTFVAGLSIYGPSNGDWLEAIKYANRAAGVVVRKHGTATATNTEMQEL